MFWVIYLDVSRRKYKFVIISCILLNCLIKNAEGINKNKYFEKEYFIKRKKLKQSKNKLTKRHKFLISIIIGLILLKLFKTSEKSFYKTDKIRINYVRRRYGAFLKALPTYEHSNVANKTIFSCWFQGLEDTPKLGLASLNSIKKICQIIIWL